MPESAAAQRHALRQRLLRRAYAVALPLVVAGLVVRLALHDHRGWLLYGAGVVVQLAALAAAPLLYPKPLSER